MDADKSRSAAQQRLLDGKFVKAVELQDYEKVEALFKLGANPSTTFGEEKQTCFFIAIELDDERMFDLLLKLGTSIHLLTTGSPARSPLHHAAKFDKYHFVQKLLALGVDVNVSRAHISQGSTPMRSALGMASTEMVELLLDSGTDTTSIVTSAVLNYSLAHTQLLINRGLDVNEKGDGDNTPLMAACGSSQTAIVKLLLDSGKVDLSAKTFAGETALDVADREDMWECALLVWQAGGESGYLKSNSSLGPAKWHRPRILGHRPSSSFPVEESPSLNSSSSSIHSQSSQTFSPRQETPTNSSGNQASPGNQTSSVHSMELNISSGLDSFPPTPRAHAKTTALGSCFYSLGGNGYSSNLSHLSHYNPDCSPLVVSDVLQDFQRLDLSKISFESLLPSSIAHSTPASHFKLDQEKAGPCIFVESDGVTAVCTTENDDHCGGSVILANLPFLKQDGLSYFEVDVINAGEDSMITVGLCEKECEKGYDFMPGWVKGTIGYHGDNGGMFQNTGYGNRWGMRYSHGDVVGCGILWETTEIFFTLNGEFLGVAYRCPLANQYFAALGLRSNGTQLKVNFGELAFLFDFRAPSLKWECLPAPPIPMEASQASRLYSIRLGNNDGGDNNGESAIVLLGDLSYMSPTIFCIWRQERWSTHATSNSSPLLVEFHSMAAIGDSIYFFVSTDWNSSKGLYRVTFSTRVQPKDTTMSADSSDPTLVEHLDITWHQIFPKHAGEPCPFSQIISTIKKDHEAVVMTAVEGKLCFLSANTSFAMLDLETLEFETRTYSGIIPPHIPSQVVNVGHHIELSGGWDLINLRNDVLILDTRTGAWSAPHVVGVAPRPRSGAAGELIKVPYEKHLRSKSNNLESSTAPQIDGEYSSSYIVHAFGWSATNHTDDLELLSLQHKEECDPLIRGLRLVERPNDPEFVNFKLTMLDGSVHWWSADAIVIAARASKWRQEIIDSRDKSLVIEVSNVGKDLFSAFIKFLLDDCTDIEIERDDTRLLYKLFESYAPEHSTRVFQALILQRLSIRSRMAEDMIWAFENDLHADVSFQVRDETLSLHTIKAHKCILAARSQYFQSLLSGGLSESGSDTITISDTDYNSFRMVLYYLYTQTVDLKNISDCVMDVFMLAAKYAITGLRLQLESIIAFNLSPDNAVSLLLLADAHQAPGLKKTCAEFITTRLEEVKLSEDYVVDSGLISSLIEPFTQGV